MSNGPSPNFAYLAHHDAQLVVAATKAERYFAEDPGTCLFHLRRFAELLAQRAAAKLGLLLSPDDNLLAIINRLRDRNALNVTTRQLFHDLRRSGNEAVHGTKADHREALHQLKMARELGIWFQRTFGNDRAFDPGPFVPPPDPAKEDATVRAELELLRRELATNRDAADAARAAAEREANERLTAEERARKEAEERAVWEALAQDAESRHERQASEFGEEKARLVADRERLAAELARLQAAAIAQPAAEVRATIERAADASESLVLDERATRRLIDQQLRAAGRDADTDEIRYERGSRPQKGKAVAIAEWPTDTGPADYVLFDGLEAIGVVEAKRKSKDVAGASTAPSTTISWPPPSERSVTSRRSPHAAPSGATARIFRAKAVPGTDRRATRALSMRRAK